MIYVIGLAMMAVMISMVMQEGMSSPLQILAAIRSEEEN
jgi:hypothetical protein